MRDQVFASFGYDFYEAFLLACMMFTLRRCPAEFSIMQEIGEITLIRVLKMGIGYVILVWDFDDLFLTNLIYISMGTFFDFLCMWRSGYKILS